MAGFIGYIVHETGARWPFAFEPYTDAAAYYAPYEGLSAPAVWAALPEISKVQIILGTRAHESPFLFDTHTHLTCPFCHFLFSQASARSSSGASSRRRSRPTARSTT